MQTFHIIEAKYVPCTMHKPARIRIKSARFNQTVFVSRHLYETAVDWLKEKGFKVIGTGWIDKSIIIVTDTFEPLKPKK